MKAPVVVFVYNRLDNAKRTLALLNRCALAAESDLFIFADNAKKPEQQPAVDAVRAFVREYAKTAAFSGVTIEEAPQNRGLAASVIGGVSGIMERYGRAIVVEDDILTTDNFLQYMNDALDYYEDDARIWAISGNMYPLKELENYPHDVFFNPRGDSWGWATWVDRWKTVDWKVSDYATFQNSKKLRAQFAEGGRDLPLMLDEQMAGKIDSWAVRWCYSASRQQKFTVYPRRTFTLNIGMAEGTHSHGGTNQGAEVDLISPSYTLEPYFKDARLDRACRKHYANIYPTFWFRVKRKLKKICGVQ